MILWYFASDLLGLGCDILDISCLLGSQPAPITLQDLHVDRCFAFSSCIGGALPAAAAAQGPAAAVGLQRPRAVARRGLCPVSSQQLGQRHVFFWAWNMLNNKSDKRKGDILHHDLDRYIVVKLLENHLNLADPTQNPVILWVWDITVGMTSWPWPPWPSGRMAAWQDAVDLLTLGGNSVGYSCGMTGCLRASQWTSTLMLFERTELVVFFGPWNDLDSSLITYNPRFWLRQLAVFHGAGWVRSVCFKMRWSWTVYVEPRPNGQAMSWCCHSGWCVLTL